MKAAILPVALLVALLGPLAMGCAHATGEDAQLASLSSDMSRIQGEREREEDGFLLEDKRSGLAKTAAPTPAPAAPGPASQRSLQVGEEGSDPAGDPSTLDGEDPNDTSPRPSIRVEGGNPGRHGARGPEHIDETLPDDAPNGGSVGPPIRTNAPPSSALDAEARRSYDAALALVNGKQFDKALDAFAGFLVKWPDHPNADNAMYWRGECYFAKGEFARAAEEFEGTLARFPLGNKVPDATLKLGICQQKLGNAAKAKTYFDRLLRDFPRSEAARRIPGSEGNGSRGAGPQETP
jgi:tol-pal system protein YbgF